MEIRRLEQKENNNTRPLYEEVFREDSRKFVDYYYSFKTADNSIYVITEKGSIQSMIHLNPYTLLVNGREAPAHYIVAVATREEYRRRGYMAALLQRTLKDMYGQCEPFTFLMPAAESIYLPHGFRTVYEQDQRYVSKKEAQSLSMEKAGYEDCEKMAGLSGTYLKNHYQVYAKRSEAYYQRLIKEYASDGGCLMLKKEGGRLCDIRPCVEEPEREKPKIMIRIVCLWRMISLMKLRCPMKAVFHVTDSLIPGNNRCILVKGTESSGAAAEEGLDLDSEGSIPISVLGELLFGTKAPEELVGEEGVVVTDRLVKELSGIIPLKKIFLNEIV